MDDYVQFTKDFFTLTGIDLQLYKRPQMERRLTSLRDKHAFQDFRSYLAALSTTPGLMHEFLDRMTINVSEFFRNPERWDALVPYLRDLTSTHHPLQAWSAACSTGEEPYTLSVLLEEHVRSPFQILATDIDRKVITQAEQGMYRDHQVKSVPDAYLHKYFQCSDGVWSVVPSLKKHIQYRLHNLLADPYPDSMDLIICRNVLIYFTDEAKRHVISSFANSLRPGGILFVGSTEQFIRAQEFGFTSIGPFLYRKERI